MHCGAVADLPLLSSSFCCCIKQSLSRRVQLTQQQLCLACQHACKQLSTRLMFQLQPRSTVQLLQQVVWWQVVLLLLLFVMPSKGVGHWV